MNIINNSHRKIQVLKSLGRGQGIAEPFHDKILYYSALYTIYNELFKACCPYAFGYPGQKFRINVVNTRNLNLLYPLMFG